MSELTDHLLSEYDDDTTEEKREAFEIRNDSMAEWAFEKYAHYQGRENEIDALADAKIALINDWRQAEKKKLTGHTEFFASHLTRYAQMKRAADPKIKTLSLPSGKVAMRAVAPTVQVDDKEQLIKWCDENDRQDLYDRKIIDQPKVAELKKLELGDGDFVVDEDGQTVPGVTVKPGYLSFKITAGE
ncbi:MAG: host-nuclease inhibitor Gam family protein [Candidatus Nanopelagicales bacterium]